MKLLHIIVSPRENSRTLQISKTFLDALKKHKNLNIDELNLCAEKLPPLNVKRIDGKYELMSGKELSSDHKAAWEEILMHINRFLAADMYLITTPMWNFSIPYYLKHYIDIIVQPKFLFYYSKTGPMGLAKNKKMIVITSRGGDYRDPKMKPFDLEEPYLRKIFGFVGIEDISFIKAEGMDMGKELELKELENAKKEAIKLARNI